MAIGHLGQPYNTTSATRHITYTLSSHVVHNDPCSHIDLTPIYLPAFSMAPSIDAPKNASKKPDQSHTNIFPQPPAPSLSGKNNVYETRESQLPSLGLIRWVVPMYVRHHKVQMKSEVCLS